MSTIRVTKRSLFRVLKNNRSNDNIKNTSNILQYILNEFNIDKKNRNVVNQIKRKIQTRFLNKYQKKLKVFRKQKLSFSNFEVMNDEWLDEIFEISYLTEYPERGK